MKKLDIRLNGKSVDLPKGFELELQLYSPVRQYDAILTSRAMGIELAESNENLEKLDFLNEPTAVQPDDKVLYITDIYAAGNLIEEGWSYVRDFRDKLMLDFTPNLSRVFGKYQDILLSEMVDLGTVAISGTGNANTWNSGGWVYPQILNASYFDKNVPSGWDGKMNSWNGTAFVSGTPLVPMFFLKYVLKKVGDLAGVTFLGDWWTDSRTDKLVLFNTAEQVLSGGNEEIRRHLTAITLPDLLMNLKRFFNLGIFIDATRKTVRIDFNEPKLKQAAVVDWSDRFGRIRKGTPILSNGISFKIETDSNDGKGNDAFFAAWRYGSEAVEASSEISTKFSTLLNSGGLTCEMVGVRTGQTDKKFGLRLISWNGLPTTVTNTYGSTVMRFSDLYDAFWKTEDRIRRKGFLVETEAALTANDIAWLTDIFKGRLADVPKVHVHGVDYLVEYVVVPLGRKYISKVGLYRV